MGGQANSFCVSSRLDSGKEHGVVHNKANGINTSTFMRQGVDGVLLPLPSPGGSLLNGTPHWVSPLAGSL